METTIMRLYWGIVKIMVPFLGNIRRIAEGTAEVLICQIIVVNHCGT